LKLSDVDLVTVERKFGLLFPASVREWYSMRYATGILARYSNDDTALAAPEFAIADCRWWGKEPADLLPGPAIEFLIENQGVCIWAILLDGSADPPVVVRQNEEDEGWIKCADSFSTFVFTRCWDFQPWTEHWPMLAAQESPLSEGDLSFLRQTFQEGPTTYGLQGMPTAVSYRFESPHGRILASTWSSRHVDQTDWYLAAKTRSNLRSLADSIANCATLPKTLREFG
jgi:hypothetical protein